MWTEELPKSHGSSPELQISFIVIIIIDSEKNIYLYRPILCIYTYISISTPEK